MFPRPAHEPRPLSSKKFIAFLVAEATWKAVLLVMLFVYRADLTEVGPWAWWLMLAVIVVAGFVEVGYILGQSALDKYVRVAGIMANGPRKPDPDDSTEED